MANTNCLGRLEIRDAQFRHHALSHEAAYQSQIHEEYTIPGAHSGQALGGRELAKAFHRLGIATECDQSKPFLRKRSNSASRSENSSTVAHHNSSADGCSVAGW